MVDDSEVEEALANIEKIPNIDQIMRATLSHIVHAIKDDLCVTNITCTPKIRDLEIWATCDRRDEEFEIDCRRDSALQPMIIFSRMGSRLGKSTGLMTRQYTISDPSFTPDTIVDQIRRYYRT